jgi:hypothetical protein
MEIIIRTEHVLEFFTEILQEQKEKRKYSKCLIFSKYPCLLDYDDFRVCVMTMQNDINSVNYGILKNIYERANMNIELYENLLESKDSSSFPTEISLWMIHERWDTEWVEPIVIDEKYILEFGDMVPVQLENYHFLDYCLKITGFLKPMFSEPTSTPPMQHIDTLIELFNDPSLYPVVMNILVGQEFCQEETNYWKDEKKGSKQIAVAIVKHLNSLGYYTRKPKDNEVKTILENTFKIKVGIDTVKRTKASLVEKILKIPPATKLAESLNTQNTQM